MEIIDRPDWREKMEVFEDRTEAGAVLAEMLEAYARGPAILLAIPAGGVAVAAPMASRLALPLDLAVCSKVTFPWNTESGYGAVAFDGTVRLNEEVVRRAGLGEAEIRAGIERTWEKVQRRVRDLRGERPPAELRDRPVILVDDGLASGITLRAALQAVRTAGASQIVIAVPTAHVESVRRLGAEVAALYCPNLRSGRVFAVADAYRRWRDLTEGEVAALLAGAG
jgi:predicted phosphoribosyltransferase